MSEVGLYLGCSKNFKKLSAVDFLMWRTELNMILLVKLNMKQLLYFGFGMAYTEIISTQKVSFLYF